LIYTSFCCGGKEYFLPLQIIVGNKNISYPHKRKTPLMWIGVHIRRLKGFYNVKTIKTTKSIEIKKRT
jgi:hypothetical protein